MGILSAHGFTLSAGGQKICHVILSSVSPEGSEQMKPTAVYRRLSPRVEII